MRACTLLDSGFRRNDGGFAMVSRAESTSTLPRWASPARSLRSSRPLTLREGDGRLSIQFLPSRFFQFVEAVQRLYGSEVIGIDFGYGAEEVGVCGGVEEV